MKFLLFLFLSLFFVLGHSQVTSINKGKVIDSILVGGTTNETFALYLPNSYNATKLSAIIFIFDPAARGKTGIKPFIASAEKYNYILVCSNNTKNGPYETNFEVIKHLFDHIFSKFSVDERHIYVSGFSGGARLATAIAVLSNTIQGVIGCGAGFAGYPYHPTDKSKFSYVGLVGDSDMNYQEMVNVKTWLASQSIQGEVFIYEDGHNWPPSEQLLRAFGWLELQAFEKGIKPKKDEVIKAAFLENLMVADTLEKKNNFSHTVEEYERILRNYGPYFKLDSIVEKVKKLKKLKSYKRGQKDKVRITKLEDTIRSKFQAKFKSEVESAKIKNNFKWWRKELGKLDKNYVNSERNLLQKMGKRLRFNVFALVYESSNVYIRNKEFKKALYCDRLLTVQRPNSAYIHYRAAQSYARVNNLEKLLQHLGLALQMGWSDKESLKKTKEFHPYIDNNSFLEVLNKY